MQHTTLRTAAEIALARATEIEKIVSKREKLAATAARQADRRAEWQRRLDPAAWTCTPDDTRNVWVAVGPAGQRFEFRKAGQSVECQSQSGGIYFLQPGLDGSRFVCTCPADQKGEPGTCKHSVAFQAVRMAHAMAKAQPAPEKVAA